MATGEHPVTPDDRSSELTASFSETAQALFSAGNPADTLRAVVDLAVETIDGCDFASIFVLDGNTLTTAVGTDSVAAGADLVQHRAGEGPGLDAITQGGTVYAEDLADDPRWVAFGPEAAKAGVRSALALRLSDDASRGAALILYARYPQAFGALDRAKGVILAAMAGLALSAAEAHEDEVTRHHPGRSGHPGDDRPGAGDPDGAGTHHCRPGLRHPAPCVPAPEHQDPRRGPSPRRHR